MNFYQLETQLLDQMRAARVPGAALAIVQGEEVIYANGFGVTSVEDGGSPITPQTVFRIGSTSKALTGTAVMRLMEMGRLDLSAPVKTYLPWFALSDADAVERLTIRMLLNHTAGLPTAYEPYGPRDPESLERYIRSEVPKFPLIAPPGKLCSYSNLHTDILGHVIEVITGRFFGEAMQELVFQPLEMGRSTFETSVALTYPLALGHVLDESGALRVDHRFVENAPHNPAGFGLSTVLDMANFAVLHMNGGRFKGQQLLRAETVAMMQVIEGDLYTMSSSGYGLPFLVHTYRGIKRVSHNGDVPSFGSLFYMSPEHKLGVIFLVNRITDFWPVAIRLVNDIYTELLGLPKEGGEPQIIHPETGYWPAFVGDYSGAQGRLTIAAEGGELLLTMEDGTRLPLHALRDDFYFARLPNKRSVPIGFILEEDNPVQYIMVNSQPYKRE